MERRWTARGLLVGLGALGILGSPEPGIPAARDPSGVLYFFTTPETAGGPEAARRAGLFVKKELGRITLRPVLLVGDWVALRRLSEKSLLARTLNELEAGRKPGSLGIPLYDEEGLTLARRWDIRAVPAFVLVQGGRAHRTAGSSANLERLLECAR